MSALPARRSNAMPSRPAAGPKSNPSKMETHPISFTFAADDPPLPSPQSPLRRPPADPVARPSTPPPRSLVVPPSPMRDAPLARLGRASAFSYAHDAETNNMSDLSFSSHSGPSRASDNDDDDDGESLTFLQQHAMDEFLRAHSSGCSIAKEEKWRELVRVMKDSSHGGRGRRRQRQRGGQRRSSSSRSASSSRSGRGSGRSWTNDEILGFIRIGGTPGGGDSISSALTSPTASPNRLGRYCGSSPLGSLSPAPNPAGREDANAGTSPASPRRKRHIFLNFKGSETSEGTAERSLATFPSLPGGQGASLNESLPTFPSLEGGERPSTSNEEEEEFVYSISMEDDPVRDSSSTSSNESGATGTDTSVISNEQEGGVFLDIGRDAMNRGTRSASKETASYRTTSNSTWDSLLMSSDVDDPSNGTGRRASGISSTGHSIVKNLIGQYETTLSRSASSSIGKEPSFFQRTNTEVIQSQNSTGLHRRVVSASNPTTPQKEFSHQSQMSHKINRKSRRENSLEEQVRNVLERQHSHTVRDEVGRHSRGSNTPDSSSSRPIHTPNNVTKRTKSDTVPSAQDILAELRRSPTPSSFQSGMSFNSVGSKSSLPRKISVRGDAKSPLKGMNSVSPVENMSSPDRCGVRTPSPLALAPSRRDSLRPKRTNRKTASEPNVAVLLSDIGAVNDSISSNNVRLSLPVGSTQTKVQDGSDTHRPRSRVFPCTSPLTIDGRDNRKSMGTLASVPPTTPSRVRAHPTNNGTLDSLKMPPSPVMNQSGEPSRLGLPPSKRDVPPTSTTRRMLPSVKEIAARFNSQMKSDPSTTPSRFARMSNFTNKSNSTPNANKSIVSPGSKDRIDEIRASISKLKHDGVGGIGKATSTLVRNQETGRYIIRDVDDESFDDIVLADMMRPKPLEESFAVDGQDVKDKDNDCEVKQTFNANCEDNAYIGDVKTFFEMQSRNSIDGSIMSDAVVDEAVRAAIDAMSSTSTDDIFESNQTYPSPLVSGKSVTPPRMNQTFNTRNVLNGPSSTVANEVDDFFIIARSGHHWTSFQSFTKGNAQGSFVKDAFLTNPSSDKVVDDDSSFGCAQWDDSGSDEWRDEKNSSPFGKSKHGKVANFPSPTSVMQGPSRKFLKDGQSKQSRKPEVVPAWNPFDL